MEHTMVQPANNPTLDEWRSLYDFARQVFELAPWEYMEEIDLVGVKHPQTGDLGFLSVMGMAEEHYAVGLYLGAEGLYGFWNFQDNAPSIHPLELLQIPQIQLSFEDRQELEPGDREVLKQLGLKFRGRSSWPLFRTYERGFLPWFLRQDEARFLALALEQLLDVAPRYEADMTLLDPPDLDQEQSAEICFCRLPVYEGDRLHWKDDFVTVYPPERKRFKPILNIEEIQAAKALPRGKFIVEIGVLDVPNPVAERGRRPFFPHLMLVVDSQTGMVMGQEMFTPEPSLDAMWHQVPSAIIKAFIKIGQLPRAVHGSSGLMQDLITPIAGALGFEFEKKEELPALFEVQRGLTQFLSLGITSDFEEDD